MSRFAQRLTRLEKARHAVKADPPYIFPTPPDGFAEAVLCLLWKHGLFETVEDMLQQCLEIDDLDTVSAVKAMLADQGDPGYGADL